MSDIRPARPDPRLAGSAPAASGSRGRAIVPGRAGPGRARESARGAPVRPGPAGGGEAPGAAARVRLG